MAIHSYQTLDFEKAAAAPFLAVDTETNNQDLRDGRGHALGLSLAFMCDGKLWSTYIPFRHYHGENAPFEFQQQVVSLIVNAKMIVFHNAKFDLESLRSLGIFYEGEFYDTMLMVHMINENFFNKGLDACSKFYLGAAGKDRSDTMDQFIKIAGWGMVPPELITEYAATDAELTYDLFTDRLVEFGIQELVPLWPTEELFVRSLGNMERRGIRIDVPLCKQEAAKGEKRLAEIRKELGLNPGSTKDLEKLLIDKLGLPVMGRTPQGKPSFNKAAMESYELLLETMEAESDAARLVLEYRGWQKTVSSNYAAYLELLSPDGRLRPNFKIHGTRTGRLSCEKPNLQQIPRQSDKPWNGNLKAAFIPADGFRLLEADYSQIEFRIAAAYSKDQNLIDFFNSGADIFTSMANELHMQRQDVKTMTYLTLYGGGITKLMATLGVEEDEAAYLRNRYFLAYPGLKTVANKAANIARRQGYVKYWTGRRRHFDNPHEEAHKAFNSIIQGGAAEVVKRALIDCEAAFAGNPDVRLLLTVHDSLVFEVRDSMFDEVAQQVVSIMENPTGVPDFGVRFSVAYNEWGHKE